MKFRNFLASLVIIFVCLLTPQMQGAGSISSISQENNLIVVEITVPDKSVIQDFIDSGFDVWHVGEKEGEFILTTCLESQELRMFSGLRYKTSILYDKTKRLHEAMAQLSFGGFNASTFLKGYKTVEENEAVLRKWSEDYPDIVEIFDAGDSWLKDQGRGGYDIQAVRITSEARLSSDTPVFILLSESHARELATTELAMRFIELLLTSYGKDPDITWLLNTRQVWIIPIHNPDGRKKAEKGKLWRKNVRELGCGFSPLGGGDGVDLNRNTSWQWGKPGASANECAHDYRGEAPDSEPETKAFEELMNFLYKVLPRDPLKDPAPKTTPGLWMNFHSYGNEVVYPWNFTFAPTPNDEEISGIAKNCAKLSNYSVAHPYDYLISGDTDAWVYSRFGIPTVLFEVGTDFFEPYRNLESMWVKLWPAVLYGLRISPLPYQWFNGSEITGTPQVWPSTIRDGESVSFLADFQSADQVRYFVDSMKLGPIVISPAGSPAIIFGNQLASGRHVIGAQGCRGDQCGPVYGIGFVTVTP